MNEIAKLKHSIAKTEHIEKIVNSFFDLVDQNIILDTGDDHLVKNIKDHPDLCMAINIALDTAGDLLKKPIQMSDHQFIHLPQESFFHGSCVIPGFFTPLLLLYCADTRIGIGAVTGMDNQTHFFRFSLKIVSPQSSTVN